MAKGLCLIDANVPMYAVGADHPLKQPCLAILRDIAEGEIQAVADSDVLQEILHRYTAIQQRRWGIEVVREFVRVVPNVLPVNKVDLLLALDLHAQFEALQARDSVHGAVMLNNGIEMIITADRHFDVLPGLRRLDPANWR
ncbi:MAG: type II toxin-antitoxin system VapC family toxin [Chloroflexi bacterium]|nr:type II toxin-antitoxin system VapC family toxin [Chloroflexota bacterium]